MISMKLVIQHFRDVLEFLKKLANYEKRSRACNRERFQSKILSDLSGSGFSVSKEKSVTYYDANRVSTRFSRPSLIQKSINEDKARR